MFVCISQSKMSIDSKHNNLSLLSTNPVLAANTTPSHHYHPLFDIIWQHLLQKNQHHLHQYIQTPLLCNFQLSHAIDRMDAKQILSMWRTAIHPQEQLVSISGQCYLFLNTKSTSEPCRFIVMTTEGWGKGQGNWNMKPPSLLEPPPAHLGVIV